MNDTRAKIARLKKIAGWMDNGFHLGSSKVPVGLDPLVGLIPGLGDLLSSLVGIWIIAEATSLGVSKASLLRLILIAATDLLFGSIPILGDLWDFSYKSNKRMIEIIETQVNKKNGA
jgi:hypothetical protein